MVYLDKSTKPDNLFDWIEKQFGKKTKWILSVPTSLIFVLLATLSIKELVAWTKVTYLPFTPSFFTISLFVLLCVFLVSTSLQTMAIVNTFVLALVIVFGFFVAFANIQFKDYSLLSPFLKMALIPFLKE